MPIVTMRLYKDLPLSTVREEQSQQYISFSDRIQLVGSIAEKNNESHNEKSAPVMDTPVVTAKQASQQSPTKLVNVTPQFTRQDNFLKNRQSPD